MTLKQIWCGVTTGHDYRETDISFDLLANGDRVLRAKCDHCESVICAVLSDNTTRMMRADSKRLGKAILSTAADYAFPVNAGVVRNVLGPIPAVLKMPESPEAGGNPTQPFDHKAHAATRKRGPNGQFLSAVTVERLQKSVDAVAKHLARKRNKRGQFAKGKKK